MSGSILVIDDDWEIRSTLQELLDNERYEVGMATGDGSPAWGKLDDHPGSYEVILLERVSPNADRTQVMQTLQRREEISPHLIIVIGANHDIAPQAGETGVRQNRMKLFSLQMLSLLFSFFRACALRMDV